MTTELAVKTEPKQAEIRFSVTEETIKPLAAKYLSLKISGVDAAYFNEVIRLCQERMEKTKSDRIDYAYMVELIDKIF